ncbi:MAG: hypothetical protein ACOC33_00795 [bacterium]
MSQLNVVYKDVEQSLSTHRSDNKIFIELTKMISNSYTQMLASDEGYCFKFSLPISGVNRFYSDLKLDQQKISDAFIKDWGPRLTVMHKDPYYQILLLFIYYAIQNNKKYMAENALMVLLMKIWNGRKHVFFKYCDKKVMHYVINNMTNNRHEVTKYANPVSLLKDYFVPTLLKKYSPEIKNDIQKLKRLFEQCHSRIYQLFVQNKRYNPATNRNEAQGGLLPLYMKAKKEGLHMQSTTIYGDDESGFDEYSSANNRDKITNQVVDNITMNSNPQYSNAIIQNINKQTKVSNRIIVSILREMHNHKYHDTLIDIISILLSKMNIVDKSDICGSSFSNQIKNKIIKSKNNTEIRKLHMLINSMLDEILPKIANTKLSQYSNVHQMQIRNVIVYGIQHNLVKTVCR